MLNVAFLGCDSTHTEAYGRLMNGADAPFAGQARVVSLWGIDRSERDAKAAALGIARGADGIAEAVAGVDFAMVIGRFGDGHEQPARVAVEAGVPTFVDKPFTDGIDSARRLADLAAQRNVPLCSGSPLRFCREVSAMRARAAVPGATVIAAAPAACTDLGPDPRLDSALFYGIHALEMLLELCGNRPMSPRIAFARNAVTVSLASKDGPEGILHLIRGVPEFYTLDVFAPDGHERREIELDGSYYRDSLDFLLNRFVPGQAAISLDSSLLAIEVLERVDRDNPFRRGGRAP
jgi:predicted dehydrogenase